MRNATINDRTLKQSLSRADKVEQELPKIIQVTPSDWDVVILAKEIRRLQKQLDSILYCFLKDYSITERKDLYGNTIDGYELYSSGSVGGHMQQMCYDYILKFYGRDRIENALLEKRKYQSFLYSDEHKNWNNVNDILKLLDNKIKELSEDLKYDI